MKICHINLARGFSGGERQTLLLIEAQLRLGIEVCVVAKRSTPFARACLELGCDVREVSSYLAGHRALFTRDCEAMHVHEGQAIYWALIQHLLFHVPYVVTRRIDNRFKNKWLSNLAYRKAACVVGVSKAVETIVRAHFGQIRTAVVPDSPVQYEINASVLNKLKHTYADKFIVVQAAKLYEHKGYDVTLEAAKALSENPEIQFCLLGDGPCLETLKSQAEGLENVTFLGHQTEMGAWFELADIVILPSHTEGMGSVLLEATLAATPVIGTKAGGIPEAVKHEYNGLLIDIGDAQGLADAILRLKNDAELIHKIQERAPEFIAEFSIENAVETYRSIYEKL